MNFLDMLQNVLIIVRQSVKHTNFWLMMQHPLIGGNFNKMSLSSVFFFFTAPTVTPVGTPTTPGVTTRLVTDRFSTPGVTTRIVTGDRFSTPEATTRIVTDRFSTPGSTPITTEPTIGKNRCYVLMSSYLHIFAPLEVGLTITAGDFIGLQSPLPTLALEGVTYFDIRSTVPGRISILFLNSP